MAAIFHELRPTDDAPPPPLVDLAFLRRAASLEELDDAALDLVRAAAESLVLELLGWPEATDGSRCIARRTYVETIVLDAPAPALDLSRRPALVTGVLLDGVAVGAGAYRVMESAGRVAWRAAWPAPGAEIAVFYNGGWRTPAQGAGEGPALPASLAEAVFRAAQILGEAAARDDGVAVVRADFEIPGLATSSRSWASTGRAVEDEIGPLLKTAVFFAGT